MDDEFALCWNNFQDNIATGFQNLYDRGDLVDVTLACDGKLLQAHKIVLAICSPYFAEMFITNPCKHPIIILKDVKYTVMCELLQFMYQGVVNVKHAELEYFMKMAQTLQIKGLTTSSTQKSPHQNAGLNSKHSGNSSSNEGSSNNIIETKINSAPPLSKISSNSSTQSLSHMKRDFPNSESISIYPKSKHLKRSSDDSETDINNDSMEHMNPDEVFLPPIPQISMVESRFDLNNVKRELADHPPSPGTVRNSVPHPFNFEYNNMYSNKPVEYPNELHMTNDFQKAGGNHMDVPAGNITMLSSTSLLHGNCIFNRNNTVATQQGMKTYWLCKSYRITMCRARCITHQGRVISATGVHNHPPHIKPHNNNDFLTPLISSVTASNAVNNNNFVGVTSSNSLGTPSNARVSQNQHYLNNQQNQQYSQSHYGSQPFQSSHHHQIHHAPGTGMQGHHQHSTNNSTALQNMMQNVLSQNNLMHLTNMAPMLNTLPQHSAGQIPNIQPPSSLQITPILNNSPNINSPSNRSSNQSQNHVDSPNMQVSSIGSPTHINHSSNGATSSNSNIQVPSSSSLVSTSTSPEDDTNCPSESHDSENTSESNILSSITISPSQQPFKMEHI